MRGLTFADGAAYYCSGAGSDPNGGGGVWCAKTDPTQLTVVDCAFVNCHARQGGGVYYATLARCLVANCSATHYGSGARDCYAYNSVFAFNFENTAANQAPGAVDYSFGTYNCTVYGNENKAFNTAESSIKGVYNTLAVNCDDAEMHKSVAPSAWNCVTENAKQNTNDCVVVASGAVELFSPATGDWRLSAGAASLTAADAKWLDGIPEEFRYTDYYGNARTNADGAVYCGAVQAVATPTAHRFRITNFEQETVGWLGTDGGFWLPRSTYVQSETDPVMVTLKYRAVKRPLITYLQDGSVIPPLKDDTATFMFTDAEASEQTLAGSTAVKTAYADAVNGSDDATTNDGSAEKPWKTLQKAVDAVGSDTAVIYAAEGDYNEGGAVEEDLTNRVSVTTKQYMRIRATGDCAKTFITGAADHAIDLDNKDYGYGPASVRCVGINKDTAGCIVQGFTLRDGSAADGDNNDACGGAFSNRDGKNGILADCVITNSMARRGAATYGGRAYRTRFTGNCSTKLGVIRETRLYACLLDHNTTRENGGVVADLATRAYQTTIVTNETSGVSSIDEAVGCIGQLGGSYDSYTGQEYITNDTYSVYGKMRTTPVNESTVIGTVYFANPATGDWRTLTCNTLTHRLPYTQVKTAMDFTGRPYAVDANGLCVIGAFAEEAPGVKVEATAAGGVTPSGVITIPDDGSIELTAESGLNGRRLLAFDIGGVTQEVSSATIAVKAADALAATEPLVVRPVYQTAFTVDVANGTDDENVGEQPFKTLAAASAIAGAAGDVVTVLPGTYEEGGQVLTAADQGWSSGDSTVGYRVWVKPGVTFVSRDGAAATVIKGRDATGEDKDDYGCGPNALRCAFVGKDAVLKGFTLEGGRTLNMTKTAHDDTVDCGGGAVCGPKATFKPDAWALALVEDCILTNAVSGRAAARFVRLRSCQVLGCRGTWLVSGARDSVLESTYVKNCTGGGAVVYDCPLYNCTVEASGTTTQWDYSSATYAQTFPIVNTAFLGAGEIRAWLMYNCAYLSSATLKNATSNGFQNVNAVVSDNLGCTEGRPAKSSPLVDKGDGARVTADQLAGLDAAGGQRVYNGRIDIGAFEYDWRADFAKTLTSSSFLSVTAADPDVVRAEGRLEITNGEMSVTWTDPKVENKNSKYVFTAGVTGTGTLGIWLNGELLGTRTASDGEGTLEFKNTQIADNRLRFTYEPGEDDTGAAYLASFQCKHGFSITLR